MGISYFDFVSDPAISALFRQAVLTAVAVDTLPISAIQIVYFYGQVNNTILQVTLPMFYYSFRFRLCVTGLFFITIKLFFFLQKNFTAISF